MDDLDKMKKHIKKVSERKDRKIELTQFEKQSENRMQTKTTTDSETWGIVIKELVFMFLKFSHKKKERKEKKKGKVWKMLKEMMVETFLNLASHKCTYL